AACVAAGIVANSDATANLPLPLAFLAATAFVVAVVRYAVRGWQRSLIIVDASGITMYTLGAQQTWPYEHLQSVKRVGRWHVRLCFGASAEGEPHEHVGAELVRPAAFCEAVLDWYACTQGRELDDDAGDQPLVA
ncbi:MAG TPA: hypothetical protein VFJ25_04440, partial [Casimicrobiaceae bacterium]|nr:hypothetical protein [Casimicrobiaceae bacterium]